MPVRKADRSLDRLRSRAEHLTRGSEDKTRPVADARTQSEPALDEAATRLADAVAALPSWHGRVTKALVRSDENLRRVDYAPSQLGPQQRNRLDVADVLATELLAVLPGPPDFQTVLERLTEAGEQLREVRARLVELRDGGGATVDDRRWLNSLVAELRRLADAPTSGIGSEAFVAGFTMASTFFAERLDARADEIAAHEVAAPPAWIVWRANRDECKEMVEVARTDSEADARAVVATMRHRGDDGMYLISEGS